MSRPGPLRDLTYEEVAERLHIRLCDQACVLTDLRGHQRGFIKGVTLHWSPRVITRKGLFNFLKLAADLAWGTSGRRLVEQLWIRNTAAYEYGLDFGVRFPREWQDTDRAHVRALMIAFGPTWQIDDATRRRINRWSR